MSDGELHDELKAFLVAGHTTTASALAWVGYALAASLGVQQQLKRELRAVLEGRPPGPEDLPALRYTRMLIMEALRLYPPTWITARTPVDDDEIGGYRIAADAIVLLSPFVTHRHPAFWEDPERFDPERFSPERSAGRPRFAYFPFGGGPRSCIGSGFASIEMQLVVALMAQRYHLTLVLGCRVELDPGLTLRPRPGDQAGNRSRHYAPLALNYHRERPRSPAIASHAQDPAGTDRVPCRPVPEAWL
jgi:cytochrome P450